MPPPTHLTACLSQLIFDSTTVPLSCSTSNFLPRRDLFPACFPRRPRDYSLLMLSCWATDPADRPSADRLLDVLQMMLQERLEAAAAYGQQGGGDYTAAAYGQQHTDLGQGVVSAEGSYLCAGAPGGAGNSSVVVNGALVHPSSPSSWWGCQQQQGTAAAAVGNSVDGPVAGGVAEGPAAAVPVDRDVGRCSGTELSASGGGSSSSGGSSLLVPRQP